jgi:hypothetical protein
VLEAPGQVAKNLGKGLLPTGECWCGCLAATGRGSYFLPGHDRRAATRVIALEYGDIVGFLHALGYQPGGPHPLHPRDRGAREADRDPRGRDRGPAADNLKK